eukprot:scaffold30309_cov58-Attheya_sp.AAC.3
MSILLLSKESKAQPVIQFHECLWCTSAGAAAWLSAKTPLETTQDGFLKVKSTYECVNFPGVFAAGDCCHMVDHPRPKAGVFAVRAGPPLKGNIIAYLTGKQLKPHTPQTKFLGLISTGDKYAVASRGCFTLEGAYLWRLKDKIDRTWMDGYTNLSSLDAMNNHGKDGGAYTTPLGVAQKGPDVMAAFAASSMRCGGCGAKVGATTLSRVLDAVEKRRISKTNAFTLMESSIDKQSTKLLPASRQHDDAAVTLLPKKGGGAMIQSIDFFRSFISDPFLFGKIAAVHALSDCHAMGAQAQTALALAVVPYAADEAITESTLIDMLSGASDALGADDCELVGGHTCEGAELALGFSVSGYIDDPTKLFRKQGGKVGDKIVLTKPIGTGALFASDMRGKCKGWHMAEAVENMTKSNGSASKLAVEFANGIHACTDVTGFGLVGHLLEMLMANDSAEGCSAIGAILNIGDIPFLGGALDASSQEIFSSLQKQNSRSRRSIANHHEALNAYPTTYPLVFDPQTAGGLLFFVAPDVCDAFVSRLDEDEGTVCASVIGDVCDYSEESDEKIDDICTITNHDKPSKKMIRVRL